MFNTKKLCIIISAAMLTILTSCNFSSYKNEKTRAVFDFSSIYSGANNSRSAMSDLLEANENLYADLKLEGGFTYNQTINLKESQIIQIDNIPVGSRIKALVELYTITKNQDDDQEVKSILYKGQSKTYTIIEGENKITIPLKKYKAEQDADPAEEQNPGEDPNDPNDPNGGNGGGGSDPADDTITIYVKYDPDKQGLSNRLIIYGPSHNMPTPKENDKDGQTPETAFGYINSAVEWIAANGDITKNYKILLTDYEDTPFNQGVYFGTNLNYKANSIILTSDKPNKTAIESDESYSITAETRVPVILKQIKVSTAINESKTNDEDPFILLTQGDAQVTLGENTVFEGKNGITAAYGTAVYMLEGSVTMEKNAKITGFSAQYAGGAVYIKTGSFLMKDNSEISDCHTTAVSNGGGAFFLTNIGGPHVISYLTIEDDAKILNCSTKGKGGAISVDSGKITMNSGSITGCTSYYEEGTTNGLGGAIYLGTANHADTIAILNGGTISGNTAERRGSAIYVDSPSSTTIKLKMGGDIFVDPDSNDIYVWQTGNTIELTDALQTTNPTAALITLYKNSSITAGVPVIESNNTEIIENSYSKFQIRLEDSEAANGYDSTSWRIDEDGLLAANN